MKKIILKLIRAYQKTISPDHGIILFGGAMRCRFYPSCSQYTLEAISHYGVLKGALKGLWRVLRCSPLSRGGADPVVEIGKTRSEKASEVRDNSNSRYGADLA